MAQSPKQPLKVFLNDDGILEITGGFREPSPEERAERKNNSARCGHVKRKLKRNEPLKGEMLEFALGVVGNDDAIAKKLKAGEQLSDYELHIMLDVYLLHARLC